MGSWNQTCAISNLHITSGQDVVVVMLAKNHEPRDSFCYNTALYNVCFVPFYGIYNAYGSVEDCHGFGLNIVVDAIREKLYRFGQGSNSAHDIEVNKENFGIEMLFEADHEGRLGIQHYSSWNSDEYERGELEKIAHEDGLTDAQQFELDRLASKIKQHDSFMRVTHVQIHGVVFRYIMDNWYINEYAGTGNGDTGHCNDYVRIYFKDLIDGIPEYVDRLKTTVESETDIRIPVKVTTHQVFKWNDECKAGQWMLRAQNDINNHQAIVDVNRVVQQYIDKRDWENLAQFTHEVLTVMWLNAYMVYTRKLWSKQCGDGSQNSELNGYKVLAEAIMEVVNKEQREYDEENAEEDSELEKGEV